MSGAGLGNILLETVAVVADGEPSLAVRLGDFHLRPVRVGVFAHVCQPFLDDAEYLDLLVRREPDVRIYLDVYLELAVGAEELDIAV